MTQNMDQPASVVGGTRLSRSQLIDLKKRALAPKNRPVLEDLSNVSKLPSAATANAKLIQNNTKQYLQKPFYSKLPVHKSDSTNKSASINSASNISIPSSTASRPISHENINKQSHESTSVYKSNLHTSASTLTNNSSSASSLSPKRSSLSTKLETKIVSPPETSHSSLEAKPRSVSDQKPISTVRQEPASGEHLIVASESTISLKRKSAHDDDDNEAEEVEEQVEEVVVVEEANGEVGLDRPAKRQRTQPWDDLDAEDFDDPLMVSEYAPEIFEYLYELEKKYMPNPNYMSHQTSINWSTRDVLMDWVVEIHWKLRLLPETLLLAGNIIDRFMTLRVVTLDKIQLVGTAALLIASKYEEVFPPATKYFSMLTAGNFKEHDILSAEKFVLQILGFELSYPNPLNFLRRISKADGYDVRNRSYGKYFLEIGCFEHTLLKYRPSHLAAAAMLLARMIADVTPVWNANLVHYAGDVEDETILPIVALLVKYLATPKIPHETLFKKYASRKFFKASLGARKWAKENVHAFDGYL